MAFSGTYRGVRFRSLLELSVIRNLETEGLVLGSTMLYEVTRIPYGREGRRTYVVDLTLPQTRTLIEVKPSRRAANRNNTAKRKAAEAWCAKNGWTYLIITEEELRACGEALTLEQASRIVEVGLNERAKRALRRKVRRKR
jgi:hypothetical protein